MRTSYHKAIEWVAINDDMDLGEADSPIVTVAMIADLFHEETAKVIKDIQALRAQEVKRAS